MNIKKEKLLKRKDEYQILSHEQLTELLTSPHSTDVEELRRALDMEKEKVRVLEMDLQAAREQDRRYVATVTEEIERGEWSCEINRHCVSDIESLCRVLVKCCTYQCQIRQYWATAYNFRGCRLIVVMCLWGI